MRVVEVGQYFVTKDTGDFRQVRLSGLSRIHSYLEMIRASQPIGWIQGKYEYWTCIGSHDQFSALELRN